MSDQHIGEDIYNLIKASLSIPGCIIITSMIAFISQMQIKES